MRTLGRSVEPEIRVREKGPTFFVGNPQGDNEEGIHFSYSGEALLLRPGVSELEDFLAHHVVGKYGAYKLGIFPTEKEAKAHVEKVRKGE